MHPAEFVDAREVRMMAAREHAEGDVLYVARSIFRDENTPVQYAYTSSETIIHGEYGLVPRQSLRCRTLSIALRSSAFTTIQNEVRQVIARQPLRRRGRHQKRLFRGPLLVLLLRRHAFNRSDSTPLSIPQGTLPRPDLIGYALQAPSQSTGERSSYGDLRSACASQLSMAVARDDRGGPSSSVRAS